MLDIEISENVCKDREGEETECDRIIGLLTHGLQCIEAEQWVIGDRRSSRRQYHGMSILS